MNEITSTHASEMHTRCQKTQYVQPMTDDELFDDIFGDFPDPQETGDYSRIKAYATEKENRMDEERKNIEQQQNCTVVATHDEQQLKQLGCVEKTFDIAEEDCYNEWITAWYKNGKQLEIIQNGYWYIVPN